MLVLDASITLAWGLPDEGSKFADDVLDHVLQQGATAPAIWALEVLNGILFAERAGRIMAVEAKAFLAQIRELHERRRIVLVDIGPSDVFGHLANLATELKLTAYGAASIHLARSRHLPIASLDKQLNKAALKLGESLWRRPHS